VRWPRTAAPDPGSLLAHTSPVRSAIGPLIEVVFRVMMHPAVLFNDPGAQPGTPALARWQEQGSELYAALECRWDVPGRARPSGRIQPSQRINRAYRPRVRLCAADDLRMRRLWWAAAGWRPVRLVTSAPVVR
jgi:hypothetical protein